MIDLTQWRVCIGIWCCRLKPFKSKRSYYNQQTHPQWTKDCLYETNTLQSCYSLLSHTSVLLYTLTVCIFLQLILSGDVEKNPGPVDFTPSNAVAVLHECGFNFKSKWSLLTSILNVPLEKIEKMRAIIEEDEAYEHALEIALEWWIKNTSEASWKKLVPMVYRCGEMNTADEMRKRLDMMVDDRPLKENDLVSVMTATITINNWNQLGLVLGLPHHVVDRIRQQYTSVQDHQQYILSHWIGTGCASWAGIVTALCSPLVNKQGLASKITCDHPYATSSEFSNNQETHSSSSSQMISPRDKKNNLQSYLQKRPKTDQQTQLSSTATNISTLPQHQSKNIIPDSISGFSMNTDKLIDNISECSSSIKSTNGQPTPPQSSTVMYRTHMVSDPHEIRLYRNYQRARYQTTEFPTYFKEPNPSIRKFINLELVHKRRENKDERVEGMTDKLHGNVTRYVRQREPLGIEQIAGVKEDEKLPRNILIEGDPGVGKTTLVWELCKGWGENRLLQQWNVVVLIQLRDVDAREASNLEQLLDPDKQFRSELDYIKRTCGNGVMIIFDGYDELSEKQKQRTSVFQRLLVRRLLPSATLLVTSRPLATRELPMEFRKQLHEHIEVVGFSDNDIDEYVKCKFCDTPDMLKDFQSYISSHPFIYKAMYIPLHCALVTDLYQTYWRRGKKEFAPKTITQLYTCFIHSLLERYLDDHPVYGPQELCVQELTDLPQDVFDDLMSLAELAAKGIREQEYVFDNLTHNTLGLMQRVNDSESRKSKSVSYSFLHLTLQEYLAALYWSKLSSEKVSPLFTETGTLPVKKYTSRHFWAEDKYRQENSNIHWPVLHFYGGLTGVVGTPLENIFVGMKSSVNHNVLYLLFESQNPEYISTVLKDNQYHVGINSKLQGYITGYCISHSSSTAKWKIDDHKNHLLQSMISSTSSSSMGGMIITLSIGVTDYSKCFQMLFQLEKHTKALSDLSLFGSSFSYSHSDFTHSKSHADNYICCDELSQLYKYCPKLKRFKLDDSDKKLNCIPLFSSLHLMTCLETLDLTGIVIDDSGHIVSNGLRQTTTLKSLTLRYCDLMNLSPVGLSQNKSIVSLELDDIKMNIEGYKALKQFLKENMNLTSLTLKGNLHHFNCPPNEEQSISFITRQELFEGIQQSKSLKTLSLDNFQLLGLEVVSTNSSLTSLILQNLEMNTEEAMSLKHVLIENTTLREIELIERIKSMEVAEVVAEGLQYNTGVTKLVLWYIKRVGTLVQRLRNNTTLTSLELNSLEMDKEEAMSLKQVLIENTTLREIELFECIKSMEVAEVVAEGLQYNTGVTKLTLQSTEWVGTLVQRLRNNTTLTSLELNSLEMDKEEAMSLKQVLIENTTLREIELFECIKSMEVAEVVAEGLQYNTGVTKLTLWGIHWDGVTETIIKGLSYNSSVQSLILWDNDTEYLVLNDLLRLNQTIKYVTIYRDIDLETPKYIADSLVNSNLEEIRIFDHYCTMGQDGAKVLADAVMKNNIKLVLSDRYQENLSFYSYPVDRVMYKSKDEFCELYMTS